MERVRRPRRGGRPPFGRPSPFLTWVDQHLALAELDGLPQAAEVRPAALVLVEAGEHRLPRDVAAVVVHLDAGVRIAALERLVQEQVRLLLRRGHMGQIETVRGDMRVEGAIVDR